MLGFYFLGKQQKCSQMGTFIMFFLGSLLFPVISFLIKLPFGGEMKGLCDVVSERCVLVKRCGASGPTAETQHGFGLSAAGLRLLSFKALAHTDPTVETLLFISVELDILIRIKLVQL